MVYLVLTGITVFLFIFSFPTYYAQLQIICPNFPGCTFPGQLSRGMLPWFQSLHLSIATYAAFVMALAMILALFSLITGGVIVWRVFGKSNELFGLLVSFVLILWGTLADASGNFTNFSPSIPPFLDLIGLVSFGLLWPALGMVLLTFPTGRFAPRWTWLLLLLWIAQGLLWSLVNGSPLLFAAVRLLVYGSSFAVLVYRYRSFYTHIQRQQTKWLFFDFVPFDLLYILSGALQSIPSLNTPNSLYLVAGPLVLYVIHLTVPLAIGIALLRYRLWDIDVLINRTLVYGALTAILALIYVGCIILMQYLLRGIINPNNNVAIVVSTLAIAALFHPLRKRIQAIIDRRFYRRKYDAARTLAAFSATLRNELDLNQLSEHLVTVVQETMQPTHVSLRLRKTEYERKSQATAPSRGEFGTPKIRREIP